MSGPSTKYKTITNLTQMVAALTESTARSPLVFEVYYVRGSIRQDFVFELK